MAVTEDLDEATDWRERAVASAALLARLRVPFEPHEVGKKPQPLRKDSESGDCGVCGKYHKLPALHLDYVGHAHVTERLLDVDPEWNWEPAGIDDQGQPVFEEDRSGARTGLWIRLTVGGVTRWGYGSVPPGTRDAEKQLIGDALRNAAMRFGVALDLWKKDDADHDDPGDPADRPAASSRRRTRGQKAADPKAADPPPRPTAKDLGWDSEDQAAEAHRSVGSRLSALDDAGSRAYKEWRSSKDWGWPTTRDNLNAIADWLDAREEPLDGDEDAPSGPAEDGVG